MKIISKYLLRSICEKKSRTFLIIVSIMISTALFFASNAISDTVLKMLMDQGKKNTGSAEIIIQPNETSPSQFFEMNRAYLFRDRVDYIIGAMQGPARYIYDRNQAIGVNLQGMDLYDLQRVVPVEMEKDLNLYPFSGNKIIISKSASEKYSLKIGGVLQLQVRNAKHKFSIVGIAKPTGMFSDNAQAIYAVVPKETLCSINQAKGHVNIIYLKAKEQEDKQQLIKELSEGYKRYTVKEPISKKELDNTIKPISASFMMITIIVIFISIFIISSSFKVLIAERLPVLGTFRSIGANKKITRNLLFAESSLYGLIGGVLGCFLGIGVLYAMSLSLSASNMQSVKVTMEYTITQLLISLIVAIAICLLSSLVPIIRVSRLSIKDIVFNALEKRTVPKNRNIVIGIALVVIVIFTPHVVPKQFAMPFSMLCIFQSILAVVLLVPCFTKVVLAVFSKLFERVFGNEGVLAVKDLRDNKSVLNSITLISIGISCLLMINTLCSSVVFITSDFYTKNIKFDLWVKAKDLDKSVEQRMSSVSGIKSICSTFEVRNVKLEGKTNEIQLLEGIDKDKFFEYWDMKIEGNRAKILKKFDNSRNILLTTNLKSQFGVNEDDVIKLKFRDRYIEYKIIGFIDTMWNNGNYAVISQKYFKNDMMTQNYSNIYIKSDGNFENVRKDLLKEFFTLEPSITTMKEMGEANKRNNGSILSSLKGATILVVITGVVGIANNLIISFLERRRWLAIMRSVGMNKMQVIKLIFIQSMAMGLTGGIIGVLTGILLIFIVPFMLKSMSFDVPVSYSDSLFFNSMISAIAISVVCSVSPAIKSLKLNIIQSLKYE